MLNHRRSKTPGCQSFPEATKHKAAAPKATTLYQKEVITLIQKTGRPVRQQAWSVSSTSPKWGGKKSGHLRDWRNTTLCSELSALHQDVGRWGNNWVNENMQRMWDAIRELSSVSCLTVTVGLRWVTSFILRCTLKCQGPEVSRVCNFVSLVHQKTTCLYKEMNVWGLVI